MKEDYNRRNVDYQHIHNTSRIHFDIFYEILNIKSNQKVIDIGGGYGELFLELKKRQENLTYYYDLLEPSHLQIEKGKKRIYQNIGQEQTRQYIQFFETDLFSFQPKGTYDHVILKMVLHEFSLADKAQAIKKATLLLNETGKLTIWRPYLPGNVRDFFSAVILKKDNLAGYNEMMQTRYFDSEEQFRTVLMEAGLTYKEPTFIIEYLLDTSNRFDAEFHGNQALYNLWLDFIQAEYDKADDSLKKQVKLIIGNQGIFINFQRAIYQFQ
jgi:ubiquinone/menaquinone biosynthesis C-methylase UbiE